MGGVQLLKLPVVETGITESRDPDMLGCWDAGMPGCWDTGMSGYQDGSDSGITECGDTSWLVSLLAHLGQL